MLSYLKPPRRKSRRFPLSRDPAKVNVVCKCKIPTISFTINISEWFSSDSFSDFYDARTRTRSRNSMLSQNILPYVYPTHQWSNHNWFTTVSHLSGISQEPRRGTFQCQSADFPLSKNRRSRLLLGLPLVYPPRALICGILGNVSSEQRQKLYPCNCSLE
ncbi:hypothetical protein SCHPADRAFT_173835 [Schizopora paradoxa]|uniref:Uncharacterized protein n=1 Tax=Schizopora paradoxa TaxID=27342 RepID=A0A0H2S6M7_9AGAM|nr:hypothetical protein SCHPADRAFT_173835 [Schizopora paradoxa]